MSNQRTTFPLIAGPISHDWTIGELILWMADDARQHDDSLRHPLGLIEEALTGTAWTRVPNTVALVRSIVDAVRTSPELLTVRIAQLGAEPAPMDPVARFESRWVPQVA